jgi:Arc/MetJ-type ribon-helix-helix transcriptional regulator
MREANGAARTARIALRLSQEDRDQIEQAVKTRGYESPSALIRAAIRNELDERPELSESEERIAGGFERMSREIADSHVGSKRCLR